MSKIVKATEEQKRAYAEARRHLLCEPPLYGYVTICGQRCVIAYLGEGQGEPNYELFAPEGYCFGPELHSDLYSTVAELREGIRENERCKALQPCDPDCPCEHGKAA